MDRLCSSCTALFSQPTTDPNEYKDLDPVKTPFQRLAKDVQVSSRSGCQLCTMVWTQCSLIFRKRSWILDTILLCPDLNWSSDKELFTCIVYWGKTIGSVFPELFKIDMVPESDTDDLAPAHLRPSSTDSETCRALAARWIVECRTSHENCRVMNRTSWLPTRLVDVGHGWPATEPKVVLTSRMKLQPLAPPYMTLSHLWAAETVLRLTTTNQQELMQRIPLTDLSPTFQDAVHFARQLGVRLLWIDSLCILQDSSDDWLAESSMMDRVYENSYCNIAATAASDSSYGLYQRRDPRLITPYRTLIQRRGHERTYVYSLGESCYHAVARAPLNSRGWVFQERMLSPATLHFSRQLYWECRTLQACETYPNGLPDPPWSLIGDDEVPDNFASNIKTWRETINQDPVGCWAAIVKLYGKMYLTEPTDRFAAIAGLARVMQLHTGHEYLAGLWKQHLPYDLCWTLYHSKDDVEVSREENDDCPSWSWTSLKYKGGIQLELPSEHGTFKTQLAKVLDAKTESPTGNTFTNVTGGYIQLQGRLGQITLKNLRNAEWRGDRHGHWTYEFYLDTIGGPCHEDMESFSNRRPVLCFPIALYDRNYRESFESPEVYCLVLDKINGKDMEFRRIGRLLVLLDWEKEVKRELRWISEFAKANPIEHQDLDVITIR